MAGTDYRIVRQLAGGGFSEIFEVEDPDAVLPERLILKRLSPEMSGRPAVRAAFSGEAAILRELRHPGVVPFRRCFYDEAGRACLVMEKVEGVDLARWLRSPGAEPAAALELFGRVLDAVDYLHHRPKPYLHLDLKPDNILVRDTPQGALPVLLDFGIARGLGEEGLKAYTPPYAAPEQEQGGKLGCFTDVHALGQILGEILNTCGEGLAATARRELERVAARATHTSRGRRHADAGALMLDFRRARAAAGEPRPSDGLRPPAPATARRAVPWLVAAAVLAALLLGGLLLPRPSGPGPAERTGEVATPREITDALREGRNALERGQMIEVEQHYRRARQLLANTSLDPKTRESLEGELRDLKRRIDLRISTGGAGGLPTAGYGRLP